MKKLTRLSVPLVLLTASLAHAEVGFNENVLNPNLAEKSELASLPGMTEAIAASIIEQRPLSSNVQLDGVLAEIGEDQRSEIRANLFLPINLNNASEDELKLVPGINSHMVHEFEEYRPYVSMDQFRREIGKYVDEEEVARYEQYVFVPIDLNSASTEELGTIPGIDGRMVHEFEEYRPYTSMDQFRREIGKYVDEKEVARYERYVEIK